MSMKYLGETFDIHGGGADLIFPHHENEIAQSECATGKPFARYWVHNGFVNIQSEKMSKSLGNVLSVRDLLSQFKAGEIKRFLLGTHYRKPLDFSPEAIIAAKDSMDRFWYPLSRIHNLQKVQCINDDPSHVDFPLVHQIAEAEQAFRDAMDDDFNTPRAIGEMFKLVDKINPALDEAERKPGKSIRDALSRADVTLRQMGSALGGLLEGSEEGLSYIGVPRVVRIQVSEYIAARDIVEVAIASGRSLPRDEVNIIVEYRRQRRDEKDWATADDIRAWLAERGVIVDDLAEGARWHVKSDAM